MVTHKGIQTYVGLYWDSPWHIHNSWIEKSGWFLNNYDLEIRDLKGGGSTILVWREYTLLYEKVTQKTRTH